MNPGLPTLDAGGRVLLRWIDEADVERLFAIFSDPEVMRYWSTPPLADRAAARALLDEIHDAFRTGRLHQWGIARRDDGLLLGTCTLHRMEPAHRRAEIGFALGRAHWGQGYAAEALTLLVDHAFGALDLRRLEADIDPRNAASIRACERLGFRREGLLRERWRVAGEVQDSVLMGLLRPEWRRAAPR